MCPNRLRTVAATTTTVPAPAPPATIADLLALKRPLVLAHTGGEDEFPGSTMFTMMPCGASSPASESVNASMACFDIE